MPGSSGSCGQSCLKGSSNRQSYVLPGNDRNVSGVAFIFILFILFLFFPSGKQWCFHPNKPDMIGLTLNGLNQGSASLRCHGNSCFTSNVPLTFLFLRLTTLHPLNRPVDKNKNKPTQNVYIDWVLSPSSHFTSPLFHGLLTFACQKWIPLRLRGKVNDCAQNTGRAWTSAAWVMACALLDVLRCCFIWWTPLMIAGNMNDQGAAFFPFM